MRYYLTRKGKDGVIANRWIVDIDGDQQRAFEHIGDRPVTDADATRRLEDVSTHLVNYFANPNFHLEPLPLATPRMLSPLDFRGYYDD